MWRSFVGASFILASALVASAQQQSATATARPNVIAVDDLNDWVGPLRGHPQVKTPNLDRLAARGTTFTNAHCQAPLCTPSRTSVMTGLRPSTTGVYALQPWFRESPALKSHVTLPQHFMKHGYRVLTTGKLYHDAHPPKESRVSGTEFGVWGFHGTQGPFPNAKLVNTESRSKLLDWGVFPGRDEDSDDWKVADWAIQQLTSPAAAPREPHQPLFLCVGFRPPHLPCFAPQKWFDLYPDDDTLVMPPVKADDRDDLPGFASYTRRHAASLL